MIRRILPLVALGLTGCFPYQRASSGSIGCHPHDIEIRDVKRGFLGGGARTWLAICHNVDYRCVGDASVKSGEGRCTRVSEAPTPPTSEPALPRASVRRVVRDGQQAGVEAQAHFDARQNLSIASAPPSQPELDIALTVLEKRNVPCEKLSVTANQTWHRELPFTVLSSGPMWRLQAHVEPALVTELARPEPTLTIEACGQTLTLAPSQLAVLARFAAVYRDLAQPTL